MEVEIERASAGKDGGASGSPCLENPNAGKRVESSATDETLSRASCSVLSIASFVLVVAFDKSAAALREEGRRWAMNEQREPRRSTPYRRAGRYRGTEGKGRRDETRRWYHRCGLCNCLLKFERNEIFFNFT